MLSPIVSVFPLLVGLFGSVRSTCLRAPPPHPQPLSRVGERGAEVLRRQEWRQAWFFEFRDRNQLGKGYRPLISQGGDLESPKRPRG